MPSLEEYCEVRTEAGKFRDWTSVSVGYSYETKSARVFRLQCAEPSDASGRRISSVLRLKPGDRVDIALAGQVVIREGYIKSRQAAYDARRHAVQVDGLSKAGPIFDASVDVKGGQYRDKTFEDIAKDVLKPFGIQVRLENPPNGADEKFRNVIVHHGETPFRFVARLAAQRGLWLKVDVDGTLVAGSPNEGGGTVLEEGRNIVAASCFIERPEIDSIVARSQAAGSDSLWGADAAQVSAKATIPSGDSGKSRIVLAEEALTKKEAKFRADMEVSALIAATLKVNVTHKGWMKPGSGSLWTLGETVTVKSPMLFPTTDGKMDLRVWGVMCSQADDSGTITVLDLVNESTFSRQYPDAGSGSTFDLSAGKAEEQT